MAKLLEIKDMSVRYRVSGGMLSAVNNVNLTINTAETFCLIGESGCGKSTLAFALMRLLMNGSEKISGSAVLDGIDLLKISEKEMEGIRGKKIGMIFQNPLDSLNPVYRSGTQVVEALMLDGISKSEATERTIELYKDLDSGCGEPHPQLSARTLWWNATTCYDSNDACPSSEAVNRR